MTNYIKGQAIKLHLNSIRPCNTFILIYPKIIKEENEKFGHPQL